MTDSEINAKCAEKMGIPYQVANTGSFVALMNHPTQGYNGRYDPLRNDTQCFELVKKLEIVLLKSGPKWQAQLAADWSAAEEWSTAGTPYADNADVNRAICELVAKLP